MTEIRALQGDEIATAVDLLARGMRDNPQHLAAFGSDPDRRLRSVHRMFTTLFRVFDAQRPLCALDDGVMVAVAGSLPSSACQATAGQRMRFVPTMLALGPRPSMRVSKWLATWSTHDLPEPHVHLGPVAVDALLQGQGLGTQIMRAHCEQLDASNEVGYLETDKAENVTFYERHGYEVVDQAEVIGVPNWFMVRRPA